MLNLKTIVPLGILLLTSCSSLSYDPDRSIDVHFHNYNVSPPLSPAQFSSCNHYGCAGQAEISLTDGQWQQIKELFSPAAESAEAEREQISTAIGLMEQMVGIQANTFADQACNNFKPPIESFQLDCVAEATNSTIFLRLFQQAQLLQWHQLSYPAQREVLGVFSAHLSAVVHQLDTSELFAVDSWFYANGETAVVVPLEIWRKNYHPGPCR